MVFVKGLPPRPTSNGFLMRELGNTISCKCELDFDATTYAFENQGEFTHRCPKFP